MDDKNLRAYLAELIGTFALVFVAAGSVYATRLAGSDPWALTVALATGLIYAGALAATLNLSGGYLNPAITIMLWVFKRIDGARATGLVGVQILGSVLAALVLRFVFPIQADVLNVTNMGTPHLNLSAFGTESVTLVPMLKGIAVELVLTFIVVFTLFAMVLDPRAPKWTAASGYRLTGLWLGIVVAAVTMIGFRLTGAAVNPARWFGPAIAELTVEPLRSQTPLRDHAVYWIGPIAGSLIAGWIYTALLLPREEETHAHGHTASHTATVGAVAGSGLARARK